MHLYQVDLLNVVNDNHDLPSLFYSLYWISKSINYFN